MITKVLTATTIGLDVQLIEVELSFSQALPTVVMVGLPGKAVQESKERIRAALKESGFTFPLGKLTINLAPANLAKQGTAFDLAIAVGILNLTKAILLEAEFLEQSLFLGELSLDGQLRSVNGVLSVALWAKRKSYRRLFIPTGNIQEAQLVSGIDILPVKNLQELAQILQGRQNVQKVQPLNLQNLNQSIPLHWLERENLLLEKLNPKHLKKVLTAQNSQINKEFTKKS